jgi:glycosyltransferase involved in cell wall biosynthesis
MIPEKNEGGRPRVIHLASGDLWAGAEVQTFNLLLALHARNDVDVEAILLNDGELASRLGAAGVAVTILDESLLSTWQIFRAVRRRIRSSRRCIVHTHRTKENFIGAFAAASCRAAASLRTVHGRPETSATGSLRNLVLRTLDRIAAALQAYIVAVSEELGVYLREFHTATKVVSIANGLDVARTRLAADRPSPLAASERVTIGLVGRLVPVKRVDIFLATASELTTTDVGRYRFVVVGDGPLREAMQVLAGNSGLATQVEFLGFQSDVLPILRSLDLLLMCSDHEGLPMVVLEALTLGVPVVAHATGGLPEVLSEGTSHRLVTRHEPQAYAEAVRELTAHLPARRDARASLLPHRYEIGDSAARYRSLYQSLWERLGTR